MEFQRRQVLIGAAGLALLPTTGHAQGQAPARVPFTLLNGKMFVAATVNGRPAQAFVDSGAQASGVDAAFAAKAGIALGKRLKIRGVQGKQKARLAQGVKIALGQGAIEAQVAVLDYAPMAATLRHEIDAVIGSDVFNAYVVEIDFDGQTIAFHNRAGFSPLDQARRVQLEALGPQMTADIAIEGHPPIRALLDLGSNVPLLVSPAPAKANGLLAGRPVSTKGLGGHGPRSLARITTARTVTLAGEVFDRTPVMIPKRSMGIDANLGLPVLWRFRLYLDFGGQQMWLGRPSALRNEPFERDRTGIEADIEGDHLRVTHVARGSPAEAGGWKVGDLITRIDGEPAAGANLAFALSTEPGHVVEFTLAGGKTRTLTMADYY